MKTVVVTGAAQGVGLATAALLAKSNFRVVLLDIQPVDAHVGRLRHAGFEAAGLCGDVSSEVFVKHVDQWLRTEYGAPDGLVKPVAFVVPRGDGVALPDALRELAGRTLSPHQRPREIRLVDHLPRTATGKLQRFLLREGLA